MNQVLIDNSLLTVALIIAALITWRTQPRRHGAFACLLLLFAPLVVFLNMWAHTIAVAVVNVGRYRTGTFQYTFTVYGHGLLGVLFILVSGFNIHCVRRHLQGVHRQKRTILWLNAATAAGFLPLILLNPIAALPVLASLLSTVTLAVAKESRAWRQRYVQRKAAALSTS
jgi:hypothetical protein